MPTCVICLDVLKNPAALPCGHVFCYECVVQLVRNVHPYVPQHFCPTCRKPYTLTAVDPNLVPQHLQLHVSPSIRKLSLDYSLPKTVKTEEPVELECARLRAENASLKNCCNVWCNRARLHARTTLGLIGMVRMAKDAALGIKAEKEQLIKELESLKRKIDERETSPPTSSSSSSVSSSPEASRVISPIPRRYRSPVLPPSLSRRPLSCCSDGCCEDSYDPDCPDCQPPVKRQREETTLTILTDSGSSDSGRASFSLY